MKPTTKTMTAVAVAFAVALMLVGVPAGGAVDAARTDGLLTKTLPEASLDGDALMADLAGVLAQWQGAPTNDATTALCAPEGFAGAWQASLELVCAAFAQVAPLAAVPTSAYDQCDLTGAVCVVQEDGLNPNDPDCAAYNAPGYYGSNLAQTGVYLNRGTPDEFYARLYENCQYWFMNTALNYGFHSIGSPGGVLVQVSWRAFDNIPNPTCNWGEHAHAREATQVHLRLDDGAGTDVEVHWLDITVTPCNPGLYNPANHPFPWNLPGHNCYTFVRVGGDETDHGCEFGAPPSPPHPSEFPYGGILP